MKARYNKTVVLVPEGTPPPPKGFRMFMIGKKSVFNSQVFLSVNSEKIYLFIAVELNLT